MGDIEILMRMIALGATIDYYKFLRHVIYGGNLEILNYAHANGVKFTAESLFDACFGGYEEVIDFF